MARLPIATRESVPEAQRAVFDEISINSHVGHHHVKIKTKESSDVYFSRITVPPGGFSGWHTHPGPSLVAVKSGTTTVYSGDDPTCTGVPFAAGTGWIDEGGGHVHNVRNEGTVTLEELVFQVIPVGADRRIDAPDPGFCPF